MDAEKRRSAILKALSHSVSPISAAALAADFSVSRQIIVGDVALLRAGGERITATPRGYVLEKDSGGYIATIACVHGLERLEEELNIMVDNGCLVINVIVEHSVYGQITGELRISSRYDVRQFMERLSLGDDMPLSTITGGVHLHTVSCPDREAFQRTCAELQAAGFLYENDKE